MSTTKYIVNNQSEQTIGGNLTIDGDVVITGTTNTRPYKVYTALLTQSGTASPVATVLENTLGVISFTYESAGLYKIVSDNLFTSNKTVYFITPINNGVSQNLEITFQDSSNLFLYCSTSGTLQNTLFRAPIEIRVYNETIS